MTTLDDAAERRIAELALNACEELGLFGPNHETQIKIAVRLAWTEATEAAAKKCEARAEAYGTDYTNHDLRKEAEDCAAAIRSWRPS